MTHDPAASPDPSDSAAAPPAPPTPSARPAVESSAFAPPPPPAAVPLTGTVGSASGVPPAPPVVAADGDGTPLGAASLEPAAFAPPLPPAVAPHQEADAPSHPPREATLVEATGANTIAAQDDTAPLVAQHMPVASEPASPTPSTEVLLPVGRSSGSVRATAPEPRPFRPSAETRIISAAPRRLLPFTPRTLTRREFLAVGATASAGALGMWWGMGPYPHPDLVTRTTVPAPPDAPALAGVRIGVVTDMHRSSWVSRAFLEAAAARLAVEHLDVLILGGDYATSTEHRVDLFEESLAIFGGVPARWGRVAVMGNHDVGLVSADRFRALCRAHGIEGLVNDGVALGDGQRSIFLAGLADSLLDRPDARRAMLAHRTEPLVVVAHEPDAVIDVVPRERSVWWAVAGHLHGGQIRLPGLGPLIRHSRYPSWFDMGWSTNAPRRTYVSRGLGVVGVPFRWHCPPEVAVVTVTPR